MPMKRVCAWCNGDMGQAEGSARANTETTHGICSRCLDNFKFQQGVPIQRYLDSLPLPVVVVDRYAVVKAMNREACSALGKGPQEIVQHLVGNVFECAHARLPEGCGRTIHCSGCTIRRSVTRTFETGEPQVDVPATLRYIGPADARAVTLAITTVKAGEAVMLRVDGLDMAR